MLTWALAERPAAIDPLFAETPGEQLVARQIAEPLVAALEAPFDETRSVPGLALAANPSADYRIWRLRLRSGVSFGDGARFDAGAVLANVERWRAQPALSGLSPGLLADSPKPGQVRFILPSADPGFDRRLATGRLGIVSPRALAAAGAGELDPAAVADAGTGPFELRERAADRLLLARNTDWWGADRSLGPGIDQLELTVIPGGGERFSSLARGEVQVAERLGAARLRRVRDDPLLTVVTLAGSQRLGVERSVRGIPDDEPAPPLSGAWRTGIASG